MENPSDMPTAADYAWSSANDALSKIKALEQRVSALERRLNAIEGKVEPSAPKDKNRVFTVKR